MPKNNAFWLACIQKRRRMIGTFPNVVNLWLAAEREVIPLHWSVSRMQVADWLTEKAVFADWILGAIAGTSFDKPVDRAFQHHSNQFTLISRLPQWDRVMIAMVTSYYGDRWWSPGDFQGDNHQQSYHWANFHCFSRDLKANDRSLSVWFHVSYQHSKSGSKLCVLHIHCFIKYAVS